MPRPRPARPLRPQPLHDLLVVRCLTACGLARLAGVSVARGHRHRTGDGPAGALAQADQGLVGQVWCRSGCSGRPGIGVRITCGVGSGVAPPEPELRGLGCGCARTTRSSSSRSGAGTPRSARSPGSAGPAPTCGRHAARGVPRAAGGAGPPSSAGCKSTRSARRFGTTPSVQLLRRHLGWHWR